MRRLSVEWYLFPAGDQGCHARARRQFPRITVTVVMGMGLAL